MAFLFLAFVFLFFLSLFLSFVLSLKPRCARGDALMLRRHQQLWDSNPLTCKHWQCLQREIVRR